MTLSEYCEVIEFAQKWHSFALWLGDNQIEKRNEDYPSMAKFGAHGKNIKYIDSIYDSRDGKIWSVTFRQGKSGYTFTSNHFVGEKDKPKWETLYAICLDFLRGNLTEIEEKQFYNELVHK